MMICTKQYGSKMEILIWCFHPSKIENGAKKRKSPSNKSDTTEKRTRCVAAIDDQMNEVKDILAKVQSHGNKYSVDIPKTLCTLRKLKLN